MNNKCRLVQPNDITYMCQQSLTPLTHFAPLIQLWAGICAICFYDKLVKKFVVTRKRKELGKDLKFFKIKVNDRSLNEPYHTHMLNKIDENLELFEHRVTHLGKFYCGYTVALLVIAGFETEYKYEYTWLLIVSILAIVYCGWVIENKRLIFYKKPWTFLYPLLVGYLLLLLGYRISISFPKYEILNEHWICLWVIVLLISPVIYLVSTYYVEERMADYRWKLMHKLKDEFDVFVRIQLRRGTDFNSEKFSEDLKQQLELAPSRSDKQKVFDDYVISNLKEIFRYGSKPRYLFHQKCNHFIRNTSDWLDKKENRCEITMMVGCILFLSAVYFVLYRLNQCP